MPQFNYALPIGSSALYPPVSVLNPNPPTRLFPLDKHTAFTSINDVIQHYTLSSLQCEGFQTVTAIAVTGGDFQGSPITLFITLDESEWQKMTAFANAHTAFVYAGFKAQAGAADMQATNAWNPMAGYRVNFNSYDGLCKWSLCLPLGMAMVSQAAVILMHYPPWIAMQNADYLHNNTLARWQNLLYCCGIPRASIGQYTTIVDVNPIAAPGSGQSEYPNDYFPIMMSSLFFDNAPKQEDYIRTMLMTLLTAQQRTNPTLPLLVCGSPLYDPQATGWFRVAYKAQLPQAFPKPDPFPGMPGVPQANVLQAGTVVLMDNTQIPTPYMIANHMIAAGVTGRNMGIDWSNAAHLPDIRQYEAQDLSSTEWVRLMGVNPGMDPNAAKQQACMRWFGNETGTGVPTPPADADKRLACGMGLVDLYFNVQTVQPWYTLDQALALVDAAVPKYGQEAYNCCDTNIYPNPVPHH